MTRILVLLTLFSLLSLTLVAQSGSKADSLNTTKNNSLIVERDSKDTVQIKSYAARYNPRKALLYAAILPGLGQVYTKKYWKIPLVYGGIWGLGYSINFYQAGYSKYKLELFSVIGTGKTSVTNNYTEDQLRNIVDKYRRQRDFYIILMGLMYVLQIVDAHVDAHLKEFDLNPNLQVRLEPVIESSPMLGRQAGVSLIMKF